MAQDRHQWNWMAMTGDPLVIPAAEMGVVKDQHGRLVHEDFWLEKISLFQPTQRMGQDTQAQILRCQRGVVLRIFNPVMNRTLAQTNIRDPHETESDFEAAFLKCAKVIREVRGGKGPVSQRLAKQLEAKQLEGGINWFFS